MTTPEELDLDLATEVMVEEMVWAAHPNRMGFAIVTNSSMKQCIASEYANDRS
jgi:hypothetical protein